MNDLNDIYLLNKEDDTMVKYVKKETGIKVNNENLPRILEQLAGKDYVKKIEAKKEEGILKITRDNGTSEFHYGTHILIQDTGIYPAFNSNKKYIGGYLTYIGPTNWLNILYYSKNVIEFTLNQKTKQLVIYTKEKEFSVCTRTGVMVFDEDDNFVEAFESETGYIVNDMITHGYKKVKE